MVKIECTKILKRVQNVNYKVQALSIGGKNTINSKVQLIVPLLYLSEVVYREVSLQASNHSYVIVNGREKSTLI